MNKAQRLARELCEFHTPYKDDKDALFSSASLLVQQDEALRMALEALERVDAVERGMVTTKAHHYAAREETTAAIAKIKEVLHD